jgi:hypothetical protein
MKKIILIVVIISVILPPISSVDELASNDVVHAQSIPLIGNEIEQLPVVEDTLANRSTWIWHSEDIATNQEELLTFLLAQKITRVYIQIHPSLPLSTYKRLLLKLHANDIEAYALDGGPDWIHSVENVKKAVSWVEKYHRFAGENATFQGIQLDIEPYLAEAWKQDKASAIAAYQFLIREASHLIKTLNLTYEVVMPFWFDKTMTEKMSLAEWVITYADRTVIMAYRDKESGRNGIIALSEVEMKIAEKLNKQITIAVETRKDKKYPHVSFYEEGSLKMESVLTEVNQYFQKYDAYDGIAIHDYKKWKELIRSYTAYW